MITFVSLQPQDWTIQKISHIHPTQATERIRLYEVSTQQIHIHNIYLQRFFNSRNITIFCHIPTPTWAEYGWETYDPVLLITSLKWIYIELIMQQNLLPYVIMVGAPSLLPRAPPSPPRVMQAAGTLHLVTFTVTISFYQHQVPCTLLCLKLKTTWAPDVSRRSSPSILVAHPSAPQLLYVYTTVLHTTASCSLLL